MTDRYAAERTASVALFQHGDFTLASGARSTWKIECDALTEADWDGLAAMLYVFLSEPFGTVVGVPRGGVPLANALLRYAEPEISDLVLVVDDVWTTGGSMRRFIDAHSQDFDESRLRLAVIFARNPAPLNATALFQMPRPLTTARTMSERPDAAEHALQLCPRRVEDGMLDRYLDPNRPPETPDAWDIREQIHKGLRARHCSYCGSLHPDDFMRLVKDGWIVGPTDKNYKAYLGSPDGGSRMESKFYYQHLSEDQRREFVDLYNEQRMAVSGGGFYRLPFFMVEAR